MPSSQPLLPGLLRACGASAPPSHCSCAPSTRSAWLPCWQHRRIMPVAMHSLSVDKRAAGLPSAISSARRHLTTGQLDAANPPKLSLTSWTEFSLATASAHNAKLSIKEQMIAYLNLAAAIESSPPMTSPPPGSLVISGEASRSLAASRLAIFWSILASLQRACLAAQLDEADIVAAATEAFIPGSLLHLVLSACCMP